jgi:hypothetical protein
MKKGLLTLASISASAAVRVFVGGGYGGFYAPYWGPYYGYGYGYGNYPNSGEVKLDTKVKDAEVFIDGAYAGTTHDNRTMHLRPGNYNIEIKEGGNSRYAEKIFVAAGKTVHLHPEL